MSSEIITLNLDGVTVDEKVQIRIGGLDGDKVREYAEVVDQLPPVDVFREGDVYRLADGFHRLEAHRLAGCDEIQARVHRGGRRAAAEHSILANARHGIPMTRAEKERAVKRMLAFHPEWSDRRIASAIGVSHPTVAKYRQEQVVNLPPESGSQIAKVTTREGADGKAYPVSAKAHTRQAPVQRVPVPSEPEEDVCPHGLYPEHCTVCLGYELPDGEDEEADEFYSEEPERPVLSSIEGRLVPVNGGGETVYVSVPEPAAGDRSRPVTYKYDNPAVGAPTAAGQHCPHCGDGRGREICNVCNRNRWIIAFDSLDDYLRAQALLDAFAGQPDAEAATTNGDVPGGRRLPAGR